jgi:uncharacterized protein YutE (UPF0331/DUF86 family)
MNIERAKRYKDKLNLILGRIEDVESWTANYDAEEFTSDKKTMLAVYKAVQEIIEASLDIVAMACKDSKLVPKDDYANIEMLHSKRIIGEKLKAALTEANGLRNRLVHRYNTLDDKIAFESINALLPSFKDFMELIEKWLKEKL